jgi:hypothetical protein
MASAKTDLVGMTLSAACVVHCLLLPVAVLAAPAWNAWLGDTENELHWVLFVVALLVTGYALLAGFRRHGAPGVVVIGTMGLLVMLAAAAHVFGRGTEAMLTVAGALIVAVAHVQNVRLSARAEVCCEHA